MGGGPRGPHKDQLLITLPFDEPTEILNHLRKKFSDIEFVFRKSSYTNNQAQLEKETRPGNYTMASRQAGSEADRYRKDQWKDCSILVTLFSFPAKPSDAPQLELIELFSAGSNQLAKHPIYTDSDITITTSSGIHGPQIAEWVVMTTLIHGHKYKQLHELQKSHDWGKTGTSDDYHNVRDVVGQRLGVLGYGSIGRQVGRVAKAMGKPKWSTRRIKEALT